MTDVREPKKTALYEIHKSLNGNIIDFHGVYLPVFYSSIQEEHNGVRQNMGVFDVSHMGNVIVKFPDKESAIASLNRLLANDYSKIFPGKIIYSTMLYDNGTVVDDLIVMAISDTEYHIVVNFTNIEKDFAYMQEQLSAPGVTLENRSDRYSIIALQGPKAIEFTKESFGYDVDALKSFTFKSFSYNGVELLASRSGYTGEDGLEFIIENAQAQALFTEILEKGKSHNLIPCGLGARDTLRLEAGLPLYGQELDDKHSPLQSMIGWSVKMKKDDFIGKKALLENTTDFNDIMVGFEVEGRAIARTDMEIIDADENVVGRVTSGSFSPTTGKNIGIAYLKEKSDDLKVKVRRRVVPIKLVDIPFYKRSKK